MNESARWVLAATLLATIGAGVHALARASRSTDVLDVDALRPSQDVWRVVSLGHSSAAATFVWMQAVVRYGDRRPDDAGLARWLHDAAVTSLALDPTWPAPAAYGSMMLEELGSTGLEIDLLDRSLDLWPDDPWFRQVRQRTQR